MIKKRELEKKCLICKKIKPFSDFCKNKGTKDKRGSYCKKCDTERRQQYYRDNLEKLREENRTRNKTQYRKKYNYEWLVKNNYFETGKGKERKNIKYIVSKAVKNGQIKKTTCEICEEKKVEGHHEDYSKPLKVRWLCQKHHIERHREIRAIINARGEK